MLEINMDGVLFFTWHLYTSIAGWLFNTFLADVGQ